MSTPDSSRLLVLWTTGEKETALNMVLMYSRNSALNVWWDHVILLIWGAAARLVATDREIQAEIQCAQEAGVQVIACKRCAENLNVVADLESLGMEVFYTGEYLTDWLKSGDKILTV